MTSQEYAPVGVQLGNCQCSVCLAAYHAAIQAQAPRPEPTPPTPQLAAPPGRRNPQVRAGRILAEEFGAAP